MTKHYHFQRSSRRRTNLLVACLVGLLAGALVVLVERLANL